MRKMTLTVTGTSILALALILSGCTGTDDAMKKTSSSAMSKDTPSPSSTDAMMAHAKKGTFAGLNSKNVAGTADVTSDKITLSGYSSDEGPDLHLYLTNGTDEAAVAAGTQIGAVAFDKASQSFDLSGIDITKYTDLVIHCDKAKAVFGSAPLS